VLQLAELPPGFQLDSSETMVLSDEALAWGAVSGYQTRFLDPAAQPAGPNRVESAVVVFRTQGGAKNAFDAEIGYTEQAPDYTRLAVATYGNESAAFGAVGTLNGQSLDTFYLFAYQGNVWVGILIKGPSDGTDLEDAVPYLQQVLGKLQ
jgi:hypothetical protein